MTEKTKQYIDSLSYYEMLSKWRFSPAGTTLFQGETGKYFSKRMNEKKKELTHEELVATSKQLGWK